MTYAGKQKLKAKVEKEMREAAKRLDFEQSAI
jgi:excinuclease UvrABC nuclease subunit